MHRHKRSARLFSSAKIEENKGTLSRLTIRFEFRPKIGYVYDARRTKNATKEKDFFTPDGTDFSNALLISVIESCRVGTDHKSQREVGKRYRSKFRSKLIGYQELLVVNETNESFLSQLSIPPFE